MKPYQCIGWTLLNTTAVTNITTTITHGLRPVGTSVPSINYYEVGGNNRLNGIESQVYSINCRHTTPAGARDLARLVAEQLTLHDALGAHARDELGITEALRARPIQAALASAGSFCLGALFPVLVIVLSPAGQIAQVTALVALLVLTGLGALAAFAGGAPVSRGAFRMLIWGALALGLTAVVGKLVGPIV